MENPNLLNEWTKIAGAILFYWCNSIGMIFLNKFLFSSKDLNLNAPLFVTWYQSIVTVIFCWSAGVLIGDSIPMLGTFPKITPNLKMCSSCLLLSVFTAGAIIFKNLTLTEIEISFYNVSLAMGTIFTVFFSWSILKQRISFTIIMICLVIAAGFVMGVEQEKKLTDVPMMGLFYGLMSSIVGPLSQIQLKRTLPLVDHNLWLLTFYTNLNGFFIYPVVSTLFGEYRNVMHFQHLTSPYFWALMTLSGGLGVSLSFAVSLQISYTSPLTANISGVAKNCIQTLLAVLIYTQTKTLTWWGGNIAVLGGSGAYTFFKMQEMKKLLAEKEEIKDPLAIVEEGESTREKVKT